jgi:hypothetical protein
MTSTIFQPIVALAAWTMIMWVWMYATRLPAMGKVPGLDAKNMVGGIGADLDKVLPGKIQWIAHNYNHLHEQPTVFYAVAFALALMGQGDGFNTTLAWAYVGLRIAHSLVQVLWNRVIVRFSLFALSGLALAAMTLHAVIAAFH